MSCYHPLIAYPLADREGKLRLSFLHDRDLPWFKEHYSPLRIPPEYRQINPQTGYPYYLKIPCGTCIGCRLDYTRSWSDRLMLELSTTPGQKACFVTLTYSDDTVPYCFDEENDPDHLFPVSLTLDKRDLQLFMKRLRFTFSDLKIRFFACGEYGSSTLRPHYHLILFGLSMDEFSDLRILKRNKLNQLIYTSDRLRDIWSNGHVSIAPVTYQSCAYVARYNLKKAYGLIHKSSEFAVDPFVLMSRRPGIGAEYFELHPDCINNSAIFLASVDGSRKITIPRYFWKKFDLENHALSVKMKSDRMLLQHNRELQKLCLTDLGYDDLLELEEERKLKSCSVLLEERIGDE